MLRSRPSPKIPGQALITLIQYQWCRRLTTNSGIAQTHLRRAATRWVEFLLPQIVNILIDLTGFMSSAFMESVVIFTPCMGLKRCTQTWGGRGHAKWQHPMGSAGYLLPCHANSIRSACMDYFPCFHRCGFRYFDLFGGGSGGDLS